ncbi:MAG: alpha/beta hydrolase, partial [Erysipelotrichaceae bacterium]|nr:alpha/beta hydrolase [Erysipelotrichaceae bacterium]
DGCRNGDMLGMKFDHIPDLIDMGPMKLRGNYVRVARMIYPDESIKMYKGPVLIVHGDQDEAIPLQYSIDANELYENCRLVVIKGDDHCYTRHLDMVTEAIRNFIRQLD